MDIHLFVQAGFQQILLISASWVTRITGLSHQCQAGSLFCLGLSSDHNPPADGLSHSWDDRHMSPHFFVCMRLGFELRDSSWATPALHFALVILEMGLSNCLPRLASNLKSPNLSPKLLVWEICSPAQTQRMDSKTWNTTEAKL
jgi:hypothetical protein